MSYRSEVAFAIKAEALSNVILGDFQSFESIEVLKKAEKSTKENCVLFTWEDFAWVGKEVNALMNALALIPAASYLFCRIGEELNDSEELGLWYENPYQLHISKVINIDD